MKRFLRVAALAAGCALLVALRAGAALCLGAPARTSWQEVMAAAWAPPGFLAGEAVDLSLLRESLDPAVRALRPEPDSAYPLWHLLINRADHQQKFVESGAGTVDDFIFQREDTCGIVLAGQDGGYFCEAELRKTEGGYFREGEYHPFTGWCVASYETALGEAPLLHLPPSCEAQLEALGFAPAATRARALSIYGFADGILFTDGDGREAFVCRWPRPQHERDWEKNGMFTEDWEFPCRLDTVYTMQEMKRFIAQIPFAQGGL